MLNVTCPRANLGASLEPYATVRLVGRHDDATVQNLPAGLLSVRGALAFKVRLGYAGTAAGLETLTVRAPLNAFPAPRARACARHV